jgi:hypothetical protein
MSSYTVDQERWSKLDIFNQMGNIYSEVGRSIKTRSDIDLKDHTESLARAINLFDATILALSTAKSPKIKEVLRSKEQFLEVIRDKNASQDSLQSLDRYFMQFAIAARLKR